MSLRIVTKWHMDNSGICDGCKMDTHRTQQMFLGNKPIGSAVSLCLLCCGMTYSI